MALTVPQGASAIAKIVAIDPGSVNLGYCVMQVDVRDLVIRATTAKTLNGARMGNGIWSDRDAHGDRYTRIFALAKALEDQFVQDQPNFVVCESPFISFKQPTAYGALMEVCYAVRLAVRSYSSSMTLEMVDPPSAKKAVNAAGNAKKPEMLKAITEIANELRYCPDENAQSLLQLDEHSIDSIAIAYWFLQKLRE